MRNQTEMRYLQASEVLKDGVRGLELILEEGEGFGAVFELIGSEGDSRGMIGGEIEVEVIGRKCGGIAGGGGGHGGSSSGTRAGRDEVPQLGRVGPGLGVLCCVGGVSHSLEYGGWSRDATFLLCDSAISAFPFLWDILLLITGLLLLL